MRRAASPIHSMPSPLPLPKRARPFNKSQKPTPLWLRLLLGRDLAPTRMEYDNVVSALWEGDPAMDDLVEWMYAFGPAKARALFTQALEAGIETVPDAPEALRRFFKAIDTTPDWVDRQLLEEAVHFIHGTGLAAPFVLRDLALMGGYLLSGFNHVLIITGALNKDASLRIAETGKWWVDCTESGGMERFAPGFKSTIHVRFVHAMVRRAVAKKPDWDDSVWGVPVNQIDMVATYLGFCVVMLGGLRKLGIPVTPRESKAVMHLWAYACWLMGVEKKWLVNSEREGVILLYHTFMTQSAPDWTSREMAKALAGEPLNRRFSRWQDFQRQWAWRQHLSTSHYFLGARKMRQLGLPDDIGPWLALITAPPRAFQYISQRFTPGLRQRMEKQGRQAQREALASMFGDTTQTIGKNRDQGAGSNPHG